MRREAGLGWVVVMPNQTMCRPSRRANKQATRVSRQSQESRAEQSRGNWRRDGGERKPSVRRSRSSLGAGSREQGAGGRQAKMRCVAVKHSQSVPAKRRARRARRQDLQGAPRLDGSDADWPLAPVTHTTQGTRSHSSITALLWPARLLLLPCPPWPHVWRQRRLGLHTLALCSARLSANSRDDTHSIPTGH
jgi:hypothetical protein